MNGKRLSNVSMSTKLEWSFNKSILTFPHKHSPVTSLNIDINPLCGDIRFNTDMIVNQKCWMKTHVLIVTTGYELFVYALII